MCMVGLCDVFLCPAAKPSSCTASGTLAMARTFHSLQGMGAKLIATVVCVQMQILYLFIVPLHALLRSKRTMMAIVLPLC